MKELRIGVVGVGFMGATHIAAIESARDDGLPCRLAAVCDGRASRRAGIRDTAGNIETGSGERLFDPDAVRAFEHVEEILACDEVDAICVCTPTDSHVELGRRVLATGRHLLVEKPVAITEAAARPLAEVARDAAGIAMPALCMRFWPGWTWLLDRVGDGSLGPVISASFRRLSPAPSWAPGFYDDPRRSGGALVDLHIHDADFVRALVGEPARVMSGGSIHHLTTSYLFENGPAHIAAEGAWNHADGFPFRMSFVVDFEDATAEFDSRESEPLTLSRAGAVEIVDTDGGNGYDGELRHFIRAALGEEELRVTLDEAVATARLLDAERESLETGAAVDL